MGIGDGTRLGTAVGWDGRGVPAYVPVSDGHSGIVMADAKVKAHPPLIVPTH